PIASGGRLRQAKPELAEEKRGQGLLWPEETPSALHDVDRVGDEEEAAAPAENGEDSHGADDALGLYLRQMGAIPLLNREQELSLARRLELKRKRYRRAALSNWQVLGQVFGMFERVHAGQLAVDPTIDVVTSLGLSREQRL